MKPAHGWRPSPPFSPSTVDSYTLDTNNGKHLFTGRGPALFTPRPRTACRLYSQADISSGQIPQLLLIEPDTRVLNQENIYGNNNP